MRKRSTVVELFLGDMGSMQRELRPSIQREDQLTMETKLEQIAVKAVNQLPKSVVREIRTPRSVGAGGGRPPPATRWARRNPRPYRDHWLRPGWLPVIKVSLASFENPIFLDRVALAAPPCGSDRLRHVPPMTQLLPRSAVAERGIFSRRCCGLSDLAC